MNREDREFLRKLEMSCVEINHFLSEVDQHQEKTPTHKEQTVPFMKKFVKDCQKVYSNLAVNPFTTSQFQKITLPIDLYPEVITEDSRKLFVIGEQQYKNYVQTRFVTGSIDVISGVISRNSLKLPKDSMIVAEVSPLIKLSSPVHLKLRNASEHRSDSVKELFSYEFTNVPECLYDPKKQTLYHNTKSQLISLIAPESHKQPVPDNFNATGLVVDLSTVTRSLATAFNKRDVTFEKFIDTILDNILSMANISGAKRIDIVADFYGQMSVKGLTRKDRGSSMSPLIPFEAKSKIPNDMADFLKNSKNKKNLNRMIAKQAVDPRRNYHANHDIVVTYNEGKVLTSNDGLNEMFDWIAESHEEADNRLILHMKDMILNNHVIRIHVRSVDTDVMIILLSFMPQFLEYNENVDVWLDHGRGDGRKTYHINKLLNYTMNLVILCAWVCLFSTHSQDVIQHHHSMEGPNVHSTIIG